MKTWAAAALLGICLVPPAALANPSDDETACKPDVFRLCSAAIPFRDRIVDCLAKNKRQLSPACHQVFNRKPTAKTVEPVQAEPVAAHRWDASSAW